MFGVVSKNLVNPYFSSAGRESLPEFTGLSRVKIQQS
jgi:hypothetical protein